MKKEDLSEFDHKIKEFDQSSGKIKPGRTSFKDTLTILVKGALPFLVFSGISVLLVNAAADPYADIRLLNINTTEAVTEASVHTENRDVQNIQYALVPGSLNDSSLAINQADQRQILQKGTMTDLQEDLNFTGLTASTTYSVLVVGDLDSETIYLGSLTFTTMDLENVPGGSSPDDENCTVNPHTSPTPTPAPTASPTAVPTATPTATPAAAPTPAPQLSLNLSADPGYVVSYDGSECEVIITADSAASISVSASEGITTWYQPGYLFIYPTQSGSVTVTASKSGYKSASASVQVEYVATSTQPTPVPSTPKPSYTVKAYMTNDMIPLIQYTISYNGATGNQIEASAARSKGGATPAPDVSINTADTTKAEVDVMAPMGLETDETITVSITDTYSGGTLSIADTVDPGGITSVDAATGFGTGSISWSAVIYDSKGSYNGTAGTVNIRNAVVYKNQADMDAKTNGISLTLIEDTEHGLFNLYPNDADISTILSFLHTAEADNKSYRYISFEYQWYCADSTSADSDWVTYLSIPLLG